MAGYLRASLAGIGDALIANRTAFIFYQASMQAGPKPKCGVSSYTCLTRGNS